MADSPLVEEDDPEEIHDHGMFDWGLFGWFALLSWAGAILVVLALVAAR